MTGTRGAFTTVLAQPFGGTLLLVAAVGLLGYAAWRLLQGVFDPDRLGHGWRGLALRVSFVALGVVHAALGLQAFGVYRMRIRLFAGRLVRRLHSSNPIVALI